jgi:nicotinamidase-related amidase
MDTYTAPDYKNIALITIDTQNDFSLQGAVGEIPNTFNIIPNITRLLVKFREVNKPIVHIVRLYKEDASNADICRRKKIQEGLSVVAPDSHGAELVNELKPNDSMLDSKKLLAGQVQEIGINEYVIYKPRWGAFYETPLDNFLKVREITTLVFTGCNFPNCPRTSIYEASERDYRLIFIKDAVSGIYDVGVQELENICCEVIKTDEFLKNFQNYTG